MGQPLMPWQRLVADVGLEVDDVGRPYWREVIVTVPRQSGKSTLTLSWMIHRALRWGGAQRVAYTAQTGWDARKKLIDDFAPELQRSALAPAVERVLRGVGNESLRLRGGSRIDVLASSETSGHGRTLDMAVLDELFADTDDRREQSLIPAMATRKDAQILGVSTAGTDTSVLLNRKVDAGRLSVEGDAESGIAYFEWSIGDDDDPDDESCWPSFMPALGHTIDVSVVRHAKATMTAGEFERSFCNRRTAAVERVFPAHVWDSVCSGQVEPDGQLMFAVDVNPQRSAAAIAVCDSSGRVELVEHRGGLSWLVDRVVELVATWRTPVGLDVSGPAGSLVRDLERAGVTVRPLLGRDFRDACAVFFDAVVEGRVAIRRHPALDDAVAAARRKQNGDTWSWARSSFEGDICPLVAVTVAHALACHQGPSSGDLSIF